MKKLEMAVVVLACCCGLASAAAGQDLKPSGGAKLAEVTLAGGRLSAQPLEECERLSLTVKGPANYWKRVARECGGGVALELGAHEGLAAAGRYTFEVRLFGAARGSGVDGGSRVAWGRFQIDAGGALVGPTVPAAPQPEADLTISDATPQLVFDDTDAGAIDWQARTSGEGATFLVQNSTANTFPLTIESDAPDNALHLANGGIRPLVGIGTSTPSSTLHVTSTLPALALDDLTFDQTWRIQSADSLKVANQGQSVLVLRAGAPGRSLQADSTGNLAAFADGGGLTAADVAAASLHVRRTNGTAKLLVEETSAPIIGRNMIQTKNNGPSTFRFDNTATGQGWGFGSLNSGNFFIGSVPGQPLAMTLTPAGNLSITGTLAQGSDRESKTNIEPADGRDVLAKVAALEISTWRYKGDEARHVGPMAQDFAALFGLGPDDKHIAPGDMAGLALAAIQALREDARAKDAHIHELEARLAALEASARE